GEGVLDLATRAVRAEDLDRVDGDEDVVRGVDGRVVHLDRESPCAAVTAAPAACRESRGRNECGRDREGGESESHGEVLRIATFDAGGAPGRPLRRPGAQGRPGTLRRRKGSLDARSRREDGVTRRTRMGV